MNALIADDEPDRPEDATWPAATAGDRMLGVWRYDADPPQPPTTSTGCVWAFPGGTWTGGVR